MDDRFTVIEKVISYIHNHIDEPLSLSRLAAYVSYSPFHFSRMFKEKIGLPPQYYVSSLRLQKAKELLLHTNLSVRDIGLEIGQQSLGTFTTRFTERVGMSPADFRNSTVQADNHFRSLQKLTKWPDSLSTVTQHTRIDGTVRAVTPFDGIILIGLFAKPIPEGLPPYGTLLSTLGNFSFTGVQDGTYYLMATSISWNMDVKDFLLPHKTLRTRSKSPIIVEPHSTVPHQDVMLHFPRIDDPPILISLPLLMNNFLKQTGQFSTR